jgi:hypothetical protein
MENLLLNIFFIGDSVGYPPAYINTTYPISSSNTITTQFDKRDLIVVGDTFQGYTIKKKVNNDKVGPFWLIFSSLTS